MMNENNTSNRYYTRFSLGQRYLHGVIMSTFVGLAFTGMVLRFSHTTWAPAVAHAVGGFAAILFFHKFCAVLLTVAFLIHVGDVVVYRGIIKRDIGVFWGPNSMIPQLKDLKDLFGQFRWFLWLGPRPKFDRFAYWEKFDYWGVFWGMAVIGFSGYSMWFAPFFARFFPGSWLNIALLIHGEEALLAAWFIFAVHFFNTHLRPGSFPMDLVIFTGRETEKELKEKHPEEYQRLLETGQLQAAQASAPQQWLTVFGRVIGTVIISSGFVLLVLTLVAFFRRQ
ncbi:MAG: formate dehydrogenase subunit gamma [Candidatus Acidiferrales bacterium]